MTNTQFLMSTYERDEIMQMVADGVAEGVARALDSMLNKKETLLTINEVAEKCKVTVRTVHNWVNQGYITAHKVGGRTLYKETEIEEAMTKRITYKQTY